MTASLMVRCGFKSRGLYGYGWSVLGMKPLRLQDFHMFVDANCGIGPKNDYLDLYPALRCRRHTRSLTRLLSRSRTAQLPRAVRCFMWRNLLRVRVRDFAATP